MMAIAITRQEAKSDESSICKPISKKMNELAKNAAYSQKLNKTMRVVGDIPAGPMLPAIRPAPTTAKTPLT